MGLGKDTAGDFASDHGGRALGPREIYEQIKNGPGIEDLSDKQDTAAILSSANGDRAKEIEELSKAMDEAWQGDSADQAKAGANPLKDWLREAEDNLYNANLTIYSQSEAYGMAWAGVEDVPDEPPEHGFFGMGKYWPGDTDTDREIAEYNEKAQKNVDAFDTYFNESTANAREMPDYSGHAFDEVGDTIEAGAQFESGPGGNPPGVQGDYAVPSGGTPGGGGVGPDGGGGDPGRVPGGGVTPPGSGGGDGTDPSDHTSPSSPVPGAPGTGPGGGGPGGSPGVPGYPGGPGAGPGGPGGGGPGGGPGGGGSRGGGAPGAPRSGGGFGPGSGPGGGAGGGPGGGSGGGAGAGLGAGKGSGAATPGGANTGAGGAGAGGPGGGAARGGAAGAGGRGMMGGMPMGGMGRGGGGDEEEHQTKYLIEEDGHELFGTDQPTAPPVIGE